MASPTIARPRYDGPLDRLRMNKETRFAYEAFNGMKARSKKLGLPSPNINGREFIAWWLNEKAKISFTRATCGRIDHSLGYSWDNIIVQEMSENSRESILRNRGNIREIIKNGFKINIFDRAYNLIAISPSIRETAKLFDVSQRLIQFLIRKKYKKSSKINFILEKAQ